MFNTYGLYAVNRGTFNQSATDALTYPKGDRDRLITALKIHNLILNVLGYIPGISLISGSIRVLSGLAMCVVTLLAGDRNAKEGYIIGRFYDEALNTGIAQIARGVLEAFVPFGSIVNASLDGLGTVVNLMLGGAPLDLQHISARHSGKEPHANPRFPFLASILYLV